MTTNNHTPSATIYLHHPTVGAGTVLPSGAVSVDIGTYPIVASLIFDDFDEATDFAHDMLTELIATRKVRAAKQLSLAIHPSGRGQAATPQEGGEL